MQKQSLRSEVLEGSKDTISESFEWQPKPKKFRQPDMAMRGRGRGIPPTGRGGGPPSRAPMPGGNTMPPALQKKRSFGNPDQFEEEQKEAEETKKEEEDRPLQIKKKLPEATPMPSVDKGLEQRKDGFFSMITGFLGFLNTRKQAYTGKPASAMYYDEKKGRYVIAGEEESDDDEPPPPPPGARRVVEEEKKQEPAKEDDGKVQGLNALTSVGFGGALANRGRGRGRGRAAPAASRFPQTFGAENLKKEEPPIEKPVDPKLFETALDISTNEGTKVEPEKPPVSDPEPKKSNHQRNSSIQSTTQVYDKQREQMWQQNYDKQQEKIKQYKYKIQRCLNELSRQREENEQTIENFTQLCQDLKFRGMDEVEDLSSEIKLMKEQMNKLSQEKATLEFKNSRLGFELEDVREENLELEQKIKKLNEKMLEATDSGYSRQGSGQGLMSPQGLGISEGCEAFTKNLTYGNLQAHEVELKQIQLIRMLDLQCENEKLNWKISTQEVDISNMVAQLQKHMKQEDDQGDLKEKLKHAEQQLQTQKEALQKAKEEILTASQKEQQQEQQEKAQLRQMISKLQQEKERVQDLQRERQTEGDQKLQQSRDKINQLEQQLKKVQLEMKNTGIESTGLQNELNEVIKAKEEENKKLQKQINELKGNTNDHQWWKDQVQQLQQIISSKDQQVESLKLQVEEIMTSQSHKSGDQVRQKLNEHIIYLQNEIRKRDDLLDHSDFEQDDDASSFEDEDDEIEQRMKRHLGQADPDDRGPDIEDIDDDISEKTPENRPSRPSFKETSGSQNTKHVVDNQIRDQLKKANQDQKEKRKTMQQILKEQIEESRSLLKQEMESRLILEKDLRQKGNKLSGLIEGIQDIQNVLSEIQSKEGITCMESQQATTLDDSDDEDYIQRIISNIFEVQRFYQAKMEDANHALQMKTLKLEDLESLTLDLEILNQEKALTDEELISLKQQLDYSQKQVFEKQQEIFNMDKSSEIEKIKAEKLRQINEVRSQYEQQIKELKSDNLKSISQTKEHYESVTTELKDNFQRKLSQADSESQKLKASFADLSDKNFELQQSLTSLSEKFTQAEQDFDGVIADLKQATDQCQFKELEKQELFAQIKSLISENSSTQKQMSQQQQKMDSQKQQFEVQISQMRKEGDERCQEIMAQRDQHKNMVKEVKAQMAKIEEENKSVSEQNESEIESLKSQLLKREDEIFWQLVNQVNNLKKEVGELEQKNKFADKNTKEIANIRNMYNEQIDDLEQKIKDLQQLQEDLQQQLILQTSDFEIKLASKSDNLSEVQNLLDYQISINDKLNTQNEDLLQKIESKNEDNTKLKEKLIDLEFKQQYEQIEKSTGSEEDKAKIYQLTSNLETKTKQIKELQSQIDKLIVENQTLLESNKNQKQETDQIVQQFKGAAEEMAAKFKEKIKKQKEELKTQQDEISDLSKKLKKSEALDEIAFAEMQGEIDTLNSEKLSLQSQLETIKKDQVSLIEHLEQSKNFSFQVEDQSISNIKHNLSIFDTKFDTLTQERVKILTCLKNAGIEIEDLDFEKVIEKLQEILQNYEEDKRQIEKMLGDNDTLHKENEDLKNKNYDLRYDLQEINIKLEEAMKNLEKYENSDPGKMAKQLQIMKEEQNVLKSDFILKIESYEKEISILKNQSFELKAENAVGSKRQADNKYADLSINNDLKFEPLTKEELNETRIRPSPEKPKAKKEPIKPPPQAQGGFLNSFASLFLTESEMSGSSKAKLETGDQSEYEYYEEYDEEEEGQDAI